MAPTLTFGEADDGRVEWDMARDPHHLVVGEAGSGKTGHLLNLALAARDHGYPVTLVTSRPHLDHAVVVLEGTGAQVLDDENLSEVLEHDLRRMDAVYAQMQERPGQEPTVGHSLTILDGLDPLRGDDARAFSMLARLGRGAGIHYAISLLQPSADTWQRPELCHVTHLGDLSPQASQMLFTSASFAKRYPRGAGVTTTADGTLQEFVGDVPGGAAA